MRETSNLWTRFALTVIWTMCATPAALAQSLKQGDYTIYYTTFPSTIIPAEVAAAHNIVRSDNRIVLNISARQSIGGVESPVAVGVKGHVVNLLEQQIELQFLEVREQDAIYYLADHLSLEIDLLRFNIEVTPPDGDPINLNILRRYE